MCVTHLKYIIGFCLFLFLNLGITCQELVNPSFEGVTGINRLPEGWERYGSSSSPDTQPGFWLVDHESSHGLSYLSMVCRGNTTIDSYLWEACTQHLGNPLLVGKEYRYSVDLAKSISFTADTFSFNNSVNMRVWGKSRNSEKELLWESGSIDHQEWRTYYFDVRPNIRVEQVILEAYYSTELPNCGNILIDNIEYYPENSINPIQEVNLDLVEGENIYPERENNDLPSQIEGREIREKKELVFYGNKLTITIWDNRTADGDIVSLFLNEKKILNEFVIGKDRMTMDLDVEEGRSYYLTLYAHNLGDIPPNTVAMYIGDKRKKKFITLTSDMEACGSLKISMNKDSSVSGS